ncbi:hypothetical protein [Bradyrhizobium australafricanum]|uniref:hypothetical protein n=1 Tax=Bradyrhizobium australafricanum TaxID=2821406 RepID=UPI001CE36AFA|nr:hypothetical protein [Bradyrhizobium australafricanum]MCA6101215.1 hypothetical protein [Bradyrhizobium australafricanum]
MSESKFRALEQRGRVMIGALFGKREDEFSSNQEAIQFCEQQTDLWRRLLTQLSQQSANPIFRNLQNEIDQAKFETASRSDGGFVVRARIPLLTSEALKQITELAQTSRENLIMVVAATLIECREIGGNARFQNDLTLELLSAMLVYASGGALTQDVGRRLSDFESRMAEAKQDVA